MPNKKQPKPQKTSTKINIADQLHPVDTKIAEGVDFLGLDLLSGEVSVDELRERFEFELERQKLDALAEFAAGAGHEINNPLAIISGHAQLLIREIENVEHQHKLATIIAQVKRAYEMIADIRFFARPPLPIISQFDIVEEINKILEEQKLKLYETNQEINIEINFETNIKPPLYLETDQVQLHIAITAICNNARESLLLKNIGGNQNKNHEGQFGRIVIRLNEVGSKIKISVDDNGIGISPEIKQLIFCPYFSGRQAGRGLGFGLPKAWKIIQQLQGSIKTKTINQITKFIITIPNKFN
ncbi:MAG: HAMP domain-containing histidine kinase [Planctomycetaceae bacterium]|nr:HAMP domain-containing histidine kinase [Planctomycetaceae bacterium]